MRVGEEKEGEEPLGQAVAAEDRRHGGGIEDVAEIDRQNRQNDQPAGNVAAEKFYAYQLASAGEDGGAHQPGFEDGEAVFHRDSAEKHGERRSGDGNDEAAADAGEDVAAVHATAFAGLSGSRLVLWHGRHALLLTDVIQEAGEQIMAVFRSR